jgi:hypothetical protein
MTNEVFGRIVNFLIGFLLTLGLIYYTTANPSFKKHKILGYELIKVLYLICCFFAIMIIISLFISPPTIIYKEK